MPYYYAHKHFPNSGETFDVYSLIFIDFTFIVPHPGNCKSLYVTLVCSLVKVTFVSYLRRR